MIHIYSFTLAGPTGEDAALVELRIASALGQRTQWNATGISVLRAKEIQVRVRSALESCGVDSAGAVTLQVGVPASTRTSDRYSSGLDLAVAVGLLAEERPELAAVARDYLILGELGLDGSVRPVRGVLAACLLARDLKMRGVLVPEANLREAQIVDGIQVHALAHLRDLSEALAEPAYRLWSRAAESSRVVPCFSEVRGQVDSVDGIVGAVARGQSMALVGAPGVGKTMLARRISTIMPLMTMAEKIAVTRAISAAGMATGLVEHRPFRAPHHTVSTGALLGTEGRPGELQLARHGVLFLDEFTEFRLDAVVALGRALRAMSDDERPLLVVASTECPCGWLGSTMRDCTCSERTFAHHRSAYHEHAKVLGIVATVPVPSISLDKMRSAEVGATSEELRAQVIALRGEVRIEEAPARVGEDAPDGGPGWRERVLSEIDEDDGEGGVS